MLVVGTDERIAVMDSITIENADYSCNEQVSDFNNIRLWFAENYNCNMKVNINEDGIYIYQLSVPRKWTVLMYVHHSGVLLKICYNLMSTVNVYDVYYDIGKSRVLYDIDNYMFMKWEIKSLIDILVDRTMDIKKK